MDISVLILCALFAAATSVPINPKYDPVGALKRRLEISRAQAKLNSNEFAPQVRQTGPQQAQGTPVIFSSEQGDTQFVDEPLDESVPHSQARQQSFPQRGPVQVAQPDLSQPVEPIVSEQLPQTAPIAMYSDSAPIRRAPETTQKASQSVEVKSVAQPGMDPRMKSRECGANKNPATTTTPSPDGQDKCCDDGEGAKLEEELKSVKTKMFQREADINMETKDLNKAISISEAAERRLEEVTIKIVTMKEDIKWARLNAQAASRRSNSLLMDLGEHETLLHDACRRINDEEIKMTNDELSLCRKKRECKSQCDKDEKYRESMSRLSCDRAIVKSEQDIIARLSKLSASAKMTAQSAIGRVRALNIDLENLQQDADVAARRVLQADAMRKKHEDCLCGKRDELGSLNQERTLLEAKLNARVKRDDAGTFGKQDKPKRQGKMDTRQNGVSAKDVEEVDKEVTVDMTKSLEEAKELERKVLAHTENEMAKERGEVKENHEDVKKRSEEVRVTDERGSKNLGREIREKREGVDDEEEARREKREDATKGDEANKASAKSGEKVSKIMTPNVAPNAELTSRLHGRRRPQSPRRQVNDTALGALQPVPMSECAKQMASGQPSPLFQAIITGGKVQEDYARVVQQRLAADSAVSGEIDEVLKAEQVASATQARLRDAVGKIERLKIAILATQEDADKVKEDMRSAQARIDYHSKRKLEERQKLEKLYSDVTNIEISDCVSKETMKAVTKAPRPQDDDNGLMEKIMAAESLVKLQAIETARAERDFLLERRRLADIMNKMAVQVQDLQNMQADAVRAAQNARAAQDLLTCHDKAAYEARQKANCALGLEVDVEKYMAVHMACVSGAKKQAAGAGAVTGTTPDSATTAAPAAGSGSGPEQKPPPCTKNK